MELTHGRHDYWDVVTTYRSTVKRLREYEGAGRIYPAGRTAAGYRLFDKEAVWCVALVGNLRGLERAGHIATGGG